MLNVNLCRHFRAQRNYPNAYSAGTYPNVSEIRQAISIHGSGKQLTDNQNIKLTLS